MNGTAKELKIRLRPALYMQSVLKYFPGYCSKTILTAKGFVLAHVLRDTVYQCKESYIVSPVRKQRETNVELSSLSLFSVFIQAHGTALPEGRVILP